MSSIRHLDQLVWNSLSAAGLTEVMRANGVDVPGYYLDGYVEMDTGDRLVEGREITFDCRAEDLPSLQTDDVVTVSREGEQLGEYRVTGMRPPDASGRRIIYLGPFV